MGEERRAVEGWRGERRTVTRGEEQRNSEMRSKERRREEETVEEVREGLRTYSWRRRAEGWGMKRITEEKKRQEKRRDKTV